MIKYAEIQTGMIKFLGYWGCDVNFCLVSAGRCSWRRHLEQHCPHASTNVTKPQKLEYWLWNDSSSTTHDMINRLPQNIIRIHKVCWSSVNSFLIISWVKHHCLLLFTPVLVILLTCELAISMFVSVKFIFCAFEQKKRNWKKWQTLIFD